MKFATMMKPLSFLLFFVASYTAIASEQIVFQAMGDSLERSMKMLTGQDSTAPYFISYTLHQDEQIQMNSMLGGIRSESQVASNTLEVQVRVGSYELDNTNFLVNRRSNNFPLTTPDVPLEFDYEILRHHLWLLTDSAYKNAVEIYGEKTTALDNNSVDYEVADFSRQEPVTFRDNRRHGKLDRDAIAKRVNDISSVLSDYPEILNSNTAITVDIHQDYYLDSEGTSFTRVDDIAELTVVISTQAENGAPLLDTVSDVVRRSDQFQDVETFKDEVRSVAETIAAMRSANELENYNGPVLFVEGAAIELAAHFLGSAFIAQKDAIRKLSNNQIRVASIPNNPFQTKIGARVLPREFTVYNDSLLESYNGVPLHGTIPIDAEGVLATRTNLIERGILRGLLTSRQPVEGIDQSTGNRLAGRGPVPTNLIIETNRGFSNEEMLEEFQLLVSDRGLEYGILAKRAVRGVGVIGSQPKSMMINEVYKVYPDGTQELMQQGRVSQFVLSNFKDIIAASERVNVKTHMGRYAVGSPPSTATNIMSVATPDLLFEEITLTPAQTVRAKPPILPSPMEES